MSDKTRPSSVSKNETNAPGALSRRHLIAGMAGLFAGAGIVQAQQGRAQGPPPPQAPRAGTVADVKGTLPQAQIGKLKISRMIFGGNLMGGWAHSRDLAYVSKLTLAYNTNEKVFETLALAEKCGVNALITSPLLIPVVKEYWRKAGGKIQFISDCGAGDLLTAVNKSIDAGATGGYVHGMSADALVEKGDFDQISRALELLRKNRMPAGIGAHKLETIKACVARGLTPDFWMKTFHNVDYWSARLEPQSDNIWCINPDETRAFMKDLKQPWIAFKTMAAGAIPPQDGFKFAFENGADFICVGMFDWQVVDNVNTAVAVLKGLTMRERPWRA
jgi:hypothetical protein